MLGSHFTFTSGGKTFILLIKDTTGSYFITNEPLCYEFDVNIHAKLIV